MRTVLFNEVDPCCSPLTEQGMGHTLRENKQLTIGILLIGLLLFLSIFGNWMVPHDPFSQGNLIQERFLKPSLDHPFGTDKFARDLFSRVVYGGRISLTIAFCVVFLSLTIGLFYGTLSGYIGGMVDAIMMRILDFLLAFPVIFLIIALMAIFRPGLGLLILILSFTSWMEVARLVRAEVLSLKESDFILAAKGLGLGNFHILRHHIIPNCLTPIFVVAPLKIGEIILLESALSFLGIGVQPPTPSWGNIIQEGRDVLFSAWWISLFPGIFIFLTVMGLNLIGDGIRKQFPIKG